MSLPIRRRTSAALIGGLLPLVLLALVACTAVPAASAPPTAAPTATPAPSVAAATPSPLATSSAAPASQAPSAPTATQTDTAWGRIWDALPPSFPTYPGAQPAPIGEGPASAMLQLPAQADVAADWTREALEAAGFTIAASNGPLEDGSYVIDATGDGTCMAQVSIAPMGGVTIATILLGADCPFS